MLNPKTSRKRMEKKMNDKKIIGLGIETSCDETAAAIVRDGHEVLANPIYSQIPLHQKFGGIVPEISARAHLEKLPFILKHVLKEHKPDYIAVTVRPGLIGSLLMGYNAALVVSHELGIPVIPIHHLEAHLYAVHLTDFEIKYPFLGLLVSGGNSAIYLVHDLGVFETLGDTKDDACGEALDKAAATLELPYPGGPHIERLANEFYEKEISSGKTKEKINGENPLPKILKDQARNDFDLSFSGIKTALMYLLKKDKKKYSKEALAYYFQARLIEVIVRNTRKALLEHKSKKKHKISSLVAAGGVMANQTLRNALNQMSQENGLEFACPPIEFCTDNAAMVASLGYFYYQRNSWPACTSVSSSRKFWREFC